jgi:hypothetical protein
MAPALVMTTSPHRSQSSANASEEMGLAYVIKRDASTPTTLFAGAERGVFKSVDTGGAWTATTPDPSDRRPGDRSSDSGYRVCGNRSGPFKGAYVLGAGRQQERVKGSESGHLYMSKGAVRQALA